MRKGLALTAACLLLSGCHASGDRPGVKFLPGMYESVPYDTYEANPVTPDGKTLMRPPVGTVPAGWEPFLYGPGPEEALRAGKELHNPFEAAPEVLARGRKVYETFCIVCHDAKGEGNGPIIGRFPNPPNLLAERGRKLPDGQIYHIVSRGQGVMPSYAYQILPEDRWKVILYVRKLQARAPIAKTPGPEPPAAPSRRGEAAP